MNLRRKYGDIHQGKEDACIWKIDETKMYTVKYAYKWLINDVRGEDKDVRMWLDVRILCKNVKGSQEGKESMWLEVLK